MKKITARAGLAVLGVLGVAEVQAQNYSLAPLSPQELAKPFSASVALRGFYDDNYTTGSGANVRSSFGGEVSPSISYNLPLEQTYFGATLIYTGRWFEDREDELEHQVQLNGTLNHAFSERYRFEGTESFVYSREPEVVSGGTPLRTESNNTRNRVAFNFTAGVTPSVSTVLGYANTYINYEDAGFSALLDRLEHLFSLSGRWQALPSTVGVAGYQLGLVHHTSDTMLPFGFEPEDRDSRSHYGFVGADHNFTETLSGSVRVGGQYTEYPNSPGGSDSTFSPYADANLAWIYNPGSYIQAGVRHSRSRTDVFQPLGNDLTFDQESTLLYGTLNHQITPDLTASLLGQFNYGTFQGGAADDESELYYLLGLNLAYRINQFLSAEAGYNYDMVDSDVAGRDFSRNRVYIGVRATY